MGQNLNLDDSGCEIPIASQSCKGRTKVQDTVDFAPRPYSVTNCDILCSGLSIFLHIVDVLTDVNVAYQHYVQNEHVFSYATIAVVLTPSLINTLVSLHMYLVDTDTSNDADDSDVESKSSIWTKCRWLCIVIMMLLQAPLLRFWDSFTFAIESRRAEKRGDEEKKKKYYLLMRKEDADIALLRIFEFLESAPQQVIQLCSLLLGRPVRTRVPAVMISICSSVGSMAWSLMSYQRVVRYAQEDKDNITKHGSICIFMWQLMMAISRILALSALASVHWPATIVCVFVHWILMLMMLSCCESLRFCSNNEPDARWYHRLGDQLFNVALSLAYIFLYISPGDGPTRGRYAVFYTIVGFENIAAVIVWARLSDPHVSTLWYYYPLMIGVIGCFFLGIICMLLYYTCARSKKPPPEPDTADQSLSRPEELSQLQNVS